MELNEQHNIEIQVNKNRQMSQLKSYDDYEPKEQERKNAKKKTMKQNKRLQNTKKNKIIIFYTM